MYVKLLNVNLKKYILTIVFLYLKVDAKCYFSQGKLIYFACVDCFVRTSEVKVFHMRFAESHNTRKIFSQQFTGKYICLILQVFMLKIIWRKVFNENGVLNLNLMYYK